MKVAELLKFICHLPYYINEDQSRRTCRELGLGHGYISINRGVYFQCPANPIAHSVFRDMAFQNRRENEEFLNLSTGCRSFVDIGASGGFFSVLFAASRTETSTILSIEPDPGARQVLNDLCKRNERKIVDWKIDGRGVMDQTGSALFVSSGYGAELVSSLALQNAKERAAENNIVSQTFEAQCSELERIVSENGMRPDLIKIDIESWEFELVQSSLDFLRSWRPRVMLELHIAILRGRGRDPNLLLASLASIGYRRFRKPRKDLHTLLEEADASGVVRAGLVGEY
jgi:FkbM family methyltransferase